MAANVGYHTSNKYTSDRICSYQSKSHKVTSFQINRALVPREDWLRGTLTRALAII
jgi:hypothetical protein